MMNDTTKVDMVEFREGYVTRKWYEAWVRGYNHAWDSIPNVYTLEEKLAFEQGQVESRNDTLMEGTF
jgi:hypothetical protein